jgi:hypothetical protein
MTLEDRYNSAGMDSYVGRVRSLQSQEAGAGRGVNFMDGQGVGSWAPGGTEAPDQFQREFTRESAGTYRYGANKSPASSNDKSYPLSRWLEKSLKLAFDGEGPPTRPVGYWMDSRFKTLKDVRNGDTKLHRYAPLADKAFSDTLQPLTRGRVEGSPSGPSPSGLSG